MKKFLVIVFILVLILSAAIIYLNNVLLPRKVKALIVNEIETQTQKKVSLDSVKINIFKGLVLSNLTIYDGEESIIKVKEVSCTVLFLPVFKKKIIIPILQFRSPVISLVRRQDNTFNLQDLFTKKSAIQETQPTRAGAGYSVFIYWVKVSDGAIRFQDNTFAQPFIKNIENLRLSMRLSFPASIKFGLKLQIPSAVPMNLSAAGEFFFREQKLVARILLQNASAKEFAPYYRNLDISVPEGLINILADLKVANNVVSLGLTQQNKKLIVLKEKLSFQINSDLKANLQYNLKDKQFGFSGKAAVTDSKVEGIDLIGPINEIKGDLTFNNSGIFSNNLNGKILELPIKAKASLTNFNDALLNINIFSDMALGTVERLLREELKFNLPGNMMGQGSLYVGLQTKLAGDEKLQIHGWLDIFNGTLKFNKIASALEDIRGRIEFERNQAKWTDLDFTYKDIPYNSKCVITDFKSPGVQLALSSQDLSLDSVLAVNNKLVTLTKLDGRYSNSTFSVSGDINMQNPDSPEADLSGSMDLDLEDAAKPLLKNIIYRIEKIKPAGLVHGQFQLYGDITDLKACDIEAKFASPEVFVYGLRAQEFFLNYSQEEGKANFPLMHMSFYGGTLDSSASMDLNSKERPYWISLDMKGVEIEKLKLDTPAKDKDVSGTVQAQATVNGIYKDISRLSGGGKILIADGKLWQLNLFKGMGALLFTKDFTNIVFSEGQCSFAIKDGSISTDRLKLKSNIVNLAGPVKIGFDKSITASLDVEVLDEMVPLSGTFRDVTTAIVGKAGRFGVIEISGTLKDPKYKFKSSVADFIKGIKNTFFH